jgi:ribosomal protein L16 Arg81 hydroxylase
VVRDGEVIDRAGFTRPARTGASHYDDLIDPGRVLDLFASGATVVLQSLHRWWPPIARFCRELEAALGHPLQANAYLTPPGAAGLSPHHDTHDVFVLQVAGSKHWVVREPAVDIPLPRHQSDHAMAAEQPVLFEADLRPGDALYLPRGFVHSAAAQQGTSLHLTLGVLAVTVHELLRRVIDMAGEEPSFRADLPLRYPFDRDAAVSSVKAAVTGLIEWLERLDPATVADDITDSFFAKRTPLLDGHLLELADPTAIEDATAVRLRGGVLVALRRQDDRLLLRLGDRTLSMPAGVEPAVRRLTDGTPHAVGDLADLLDGASRVVLVRRLVREGVLRTDRKAGPPSR